MKNKLFYILSFTIVILILPFLKNRNIFFNKEETIAIVNTNDLIDRLPEIRIQYVVDNKYYESIFPVEYIRTNYVKIIYNKNNPQEAIINSVIYWYTAKYMIFPLFSFFILSAFVLSYKTKPK